jgi:hypothetical protein
MSLSHRLVVLLYGVLRCIGHPPRIYETRAKDFVCCVPISPKSKSTEQISFPFVSRKKEEKRKKSSVAVRSVKCEMRLGSRALSAGRSHGARLASPAHGRVASLLHRQHAPAKGPFQAAAQGRHVKTWSAGTASRGGPQARHLLDSSIVEVRSIPRPLSQVSSH